MPPDQAAAIKQGIAVVWQDLALCDNLDVAANIMLGRERPAADVGDPVPLAAAELLASLRSRCRTRRATSARCPAGSGNWWRWRGDGPQAAAAGPGRADASLGTKEAAQVEELIMGLQQQGTTILLACHDIDQMFRLASRIVVLRQGRIVGEVRPADAHPDDVIALISGRQVSSARQQLTRLHGLTDRLVSADPSSSLSLILSALGAALGSERLCIHLVTDKILYCAASLGFKPGAARPVEQAAVRARGRPGGHGRGGTNGPSSPTRSGSARPRAASATWPRRPRWPAHGRSRCSGPSGLSGVITVFRAEHGAPERDELALVTVYAGYAASAIERDRLLDQVTRGTGCSRRSARCWRRWPGRSQSARDCPSRSSRCGAACRPTRSR